MWVYDNLNKHQTVRHEREREYKSFMHVLFTLITMQIHTCTFSCVFSEEHNTMLNLTARLAVKIQHVPDWEVNWADRSPQRSRQSLSSDDFLPSREDAVVLQRRATCFIQDFLTSHFQSLADLKQFVPPCTSPHPIKKSEVVPMKVFFKDEKYKLETIGILMQLMSDANLSGDHQV